MQHHHHHEAHFTSSDIIKDLVIGMSDGLTVPFALAAGLSSAVVNNNIIITAGIAEIVAGSIAMGLGGYLAGRTEVEHYDAELAREYEEVARVPEVEKQEIRDFFKDYGISKHLQDEIAEELSHDKDKWVEFMMRFELGMEKPEPHRAAQSALTIGGAYIVGGIVPLIGYFVTDTPMAGLKISATITIIFLFIFGYFKTKLTGQQPFLGALKMVALGVLASGAAYLIASSIG
jgi:VIT1/CCC1 family predicted Fe2+/Mn2+ transporter